MSRANKVKPKQTMYKHQSLDAINSQVQFIQLPHAYKKSKHFKYFDIIA